MVHSLLIFYSNIRASGRRRAFKFNIGFSFQFAPQVTEMNKLHEKCNNTLRLALRGITNAARDIMPDSSGLPFDEAIITHMTAVTLATTNFGNG